VALLSSRICANKVTGTPLVDELEVVGDYDSRYSAPSFCGYVLVSVSAHEPPVDVHAASGAGRPPPENNRHLGPHLVEASNL